MSIIHQTPFLVARHYLASRYVRVIRTEALFGTVPDVVNAFTVCCDALTKLDAAQYGILFDWRRSPISTDATLHKALVTQVDALAKPFARSAILFSTAVGAMQASRLQRNLSDEELVVFSDEDAALEFVTTR